MGPTPEPFDHMTEPAKQIQRINAQVIGFPSPGQARLLIAPGSGVLDGGVPVDIALELIPADLQVDGQMVIAVYEQDSLDILAVEPDTWQNPFKKCTSCNGIGLYRDPATGLLTNDKCSECGGKGTVANNPD